MSEFGVKLILELVRLDKMTNLELYYVRSGPDGLSRITRRYSGGGIAESWLVAAAVAEDDVLDRWAEFHDKVLGYPPCWATAGITAYDRLRL